MRLHYLNQLQPLQVLELHVLELAHLLDMHLPKRRDVKQIDLLQVVQSLQRNCLQLGESRQRSTDPIEIFGLKRYLGKSQIRNSSVLHQCMELKLCLWNPRNFV